MRCEDRCAAASFAGVAPVLDRSHEQICIGRWSCANLCVGVRADDGPIDVQRIAVMPHAGHAPASDHYTATVRTVDGMAYHCNDAEVTVRPDLLVQPRQDSYLLILANPHASGAQFDLQSVQGNAGPHDVHNSGSESDHDGPVHVPGRGDDCPAA